MSWSPGVLVKRLLSFKNSFILFNFRFQITTRSIYSIYISAPLSITNLPNTFLGSNQCIESRFLCIPRRAKPKGSTNPMENSTFCFFFYKISY